MPPHPDAIINVGNASDERSADPGRNTLNADASVLRGPNRTIQDPTLLGGFLRWTREDGSRVALVDDQTSLSYDALNRRTNRLARLLQSHGIGPGVMVGIAMPRSAALVEAILAVVKSGGAYVPLDPDYPEARLFRMLEQVPPRVLLTSAQFASRFQAAPQTALLESENYTASLGAFADTELAPAAGPGDPLYVIFTSGSTGEPKGAVVQRRGFANLLEWFGAEFSIGATDRILLLSSPSFDLTQKNFFAALRTGGTLVCHPSGPFDLTRLTGMIECHGITILNCTPSAFYPLVDIMARRPLGTLRLAVLGGEPISIARVRAWLDQAGEKKEIANTYGPTECTDICGFYRLDRDNIENFTFVPLGRPIPNVQLAVTDENLHPVPRGQAGELLIGGAGVGPGYLGDPDRTATNFVLNPIPAHFESPTVYRTGDRVRLLPGGELEFLDRMDHQVKLRGFRIELADIEAALAIHPSVREAAATILEIAGNPVLTVFHTARIATEPASTTELRIFLADRLPDYMVPANFIRLDALPLTPNGKVDRLKLSGQGRPSSNPVTGALPHDGITSTIHRLWVETLGHDVFGVNDNFFDLGGNSIQIATIHARLIELTGKPLPITDLFAHPSIHSLAARLSGTASGSNADAIRLRAKKQRLAFAGRRSLNS